jgi:hypothetical protein
MTRRPWTRLGTLAAGAHVSYELAAGVGMPFASRVGPIRAAALWATATAVALRGAERHPESWDPVYAALDAAYLSAVLAHVAGWPRTRVLGVPWLLECEGIAGRAIHPYNVILYLSGGFAVIALAGSRSGRLLGVVVPGVLVPVLVRWQHEEVARLRARADHDPGWWNRRLR